MPTLAHQRCFHHSLREAVARCPECRQFYCRECITEHDERVICASCLRKLSAPAATPSFRASWLFAAIPGALGFAMALFFFYTIGEMLLNVPASYHEGSIWVERWIERQ